MYSFKTHDQIIATSMVRKLTDTQRQIIVMRYWQNKTIDDIAQKLGLSWAKTNMIINLALDNLKKLCTDQPTFGLEKH